MDKHFSVTCQAPQPKIEIFFPNNAGKTANFVFSALGTGTAAKLLSFNFSESVNDLEGSFSFSAEYGEAEIVADRGEGDTEGHTSATIPGNIFDLIPLRSIVKIYQTSDNIARFVGIIRRRRISKQMAQQGVRKSIVYSGKSVLSCLTDFSVSLDIRIPMVRAASNLNKTLTREVQIKKNRIEERGGIFTLKDLMLVIWNYYNEVANTVITDMQTGEVSGRAPSSKENLVIIKNFAEERDDSGNIQKDTFIKGGEEGVHYPVACAFLNAGNNNIVDVWRNVLPKTVYELFSFCDERGNPKIVARQVPYEPADWSKLRRKQIRPEDLIGVELEQNDEEVYTAFFGYIAGTAMPADWYQKASHKAMKINDAKLAKYGFRLLQVEFRGYDKSGGATEGDSEEERQRRHEAANGNVEEKMKELSAMLERWYSRMEEMYAGTITLCENYRAPSADPRVGERVKIFGGEFYVTKTDHAWQYGGTPILKLGVTRGMEYGSEGNIIGVIRKIGENYSERRGYYAEMEGISG